MLESEFKEMASTTVSIEPLSNHSVSWAPSYVTAVELTRNS